MEAAGAGEDDEADLGITEDTQLLGLLEDPVPALGESHLPARGVVDPTDHYLASPHLETSTQRTSRSRPRERWR